MAISKVRICNMALSNIGSTYTIENPNENSVPAKQCNLWYDHSLQQAEAQADWTFARKTQTLASHIDDPTDNWSFRYQLPADCLAPRHLINPLGRKAKRVPYHLEISTDGTKSLLTDLEDASLAYTFFQQNIALFTAVFIDVQSWYLASNIAFALTGKRSIRTDCVNMAIRLAKLAPAQDLNSEADDEPDDAEWIAGR